MLSSSARGETLELTNGQIIRGIILKRTSDAVIVDQGVGVNTTYYLDEIKNISESSAKPMVVEEEAISKQSEVDNFEADILEGIKKKNTKEKNQAKNIIRELKIGEIPEEDGVYLVRTPGQYLKEGHSSWEERSYKNGKRNGLTRVFTDKVLFAEVYYKNDKLDGIVKEYTEDGGLIRESVYKDGKGHGLTKEYYESGALKWEGTWDNGNPTGEGKIYYESGQVQAVISWDGKDIVPYKKRYFDEKGNLLKELNKEDIEKEADSLKERAMNGYK